MSAAAVLRANRRALAAGAALSASVLMAMAFLVFVTSVNLAVSTGGPEPAETATAGLCGSYTAGNAATVDSVLATYADGPVPNPHSNIPPEKQAQMETAIHAFAAAGFSGDHLVTVSSLAGRESNYDPTAYNGNRSTGDDSYGLLQINMIDDLGPFNRARFGISSNDELFDPYVNGRSAKVLFDASEVPFFAWGPYRGDAPLHGGAELWVAEVVRVATHLGYLDEEGNPAVPDPDTVPDPSSPEDDIYVTVDREVTVAGGCVGATELEGPYCDGLTGTGVTPPDPFQFVSNEYIVGAHPAAAEAWAQLVGAAEAAGLDPVLFKGYAYGPRPNTPSSNHPHGIAIDVTSLVGPFGTRVVEGEPHPVSEAFYTDTFNFLFEEGWRFGWCAPRNNRPLFLGGTATGGTYADGSFAGLEAWHFEFYGTGQPKFSPIYGDGSGPTGVPD